MSLLYWKDESEGKMTNREIILKAWETLYRRRSNTSVSEIRNALRDILIQGLEPENVSNDSIKDLLVENAEWSRTTFGPGKRTKGLTEHIRSELLEIEASPDDFFEWVDVLLLALDGLARINISPDKIFEALLAKSKINWARNYGEQPKQDEASFHVTDIKINGNSITEKEVKRMLKIKARVKRSQKDIAWLIRFIQKVDSCHITQDPDRRDGDCYEGVEENE